MFKKEMIKSSAKQQSAGTTSSSNSSFSNSGNNNNNTTSSGRSGGSSSISSHHLDLDERRKYVSLSTRENSVSKQQHQQCLLNNAASLEEYRKRSREGRLPEPTYSINDYKQYNQHMISTYGYGLCHSIRKDQRNGAPPIIKGPEPSSSSSSSKSSTKHKSKK